MMYVRINDSELLGDLVGFLTRCECMPEVRGETTVFVAPRAAAGGLELERLELAGYLWVWARRHRGVEILVGDANGSVTRLPRDHAGLGRSETSVARTR